MVIDDFDVMGVTVVKAEADAPRTVDVHRPLALSITFQWMQSDAFERTYVLQRRGGVQQGEHFESMILVKTGEFVLTGLGQLPGRGISPGFYHMPYIVRMIYYVKRICVARCESDGNRFSAARLRLLMAALILRRPGLRKRPTQQCLQPNIKKS